MTLTLANLPWGKRYEAAGGNAALYEALIRNVLAHAAAGWRASSSPATSTPCAVRHGPSAASSSKASPR